MFSFRKTKCWQGCGGAETLTLLLGMKNRVSALVDSWGGFLRCQIYFYQLIQTLYSWIFTPEGGKKHNSTKRHFVCHKHVHKCL